jgi:NADH dehydrogenase
MQVVVVGGGFGGVKTALLLANKPGIEVILVTPKTNFEYHGALYRSATGHSPLEVVLPLRDIFKRAKNVKIFYDKVVSLNIHKQVLFGESGQAYPYDNVVFAMGNVVNYFDIDGMDRHSHPMDTIGNTMQLRQEIMRLVRTAGSNHTIRFAVIGGGATGVELAAELPSFIRRVVKRYALGKRKVEIVLVEGAPRVLPMLQERASAKVAQRLRKLGIHLQLSTKVNACKSGSVCLSVGDLRADLIIWTAGSKIAPFFSQYPDIFQLEKGRVHVDEHLRVFGHKHLYVIGDNAATPYSGMAQTALHDAKYVAATLIRENQGKPARKYQARHPLYVVPVGPRWAIVQTKKKILGGYRGWRIRRHADLWIFRNFEPYGKAIVTWRKGSRLARFFR